MLWEFSCATSKLTEGTLVYEEGKSPAIAVPVAVFVLRWFGICCFPIKNGRRAAGEVSENRNVVFAIGGHLPNEHSLKRPANFVA